MWIIIEFKKEVILNCLHIFIGRHTIFLWKGHNIYNIKNWLSISGRYHRTPPNQIDEIEGVYHIMK